MSSHDIELNEALAIIKKATKAEVDVSLIPLEYANDVKSAYFSRMAKEITADAKTNTILLVSVTLPKARAKALGL